jgi:transposase
MPAERITMRQVREILRLMSVGDVPVREIGRRTGVAPSTVRATLKRITAAGLNWPLPEGLSDSDLEAQLYRNAGKKQGHRRCPEADWPTVHRELKRNKHVTLSILWDEYIVQHPDGFRYSRFCELYRAWEGKLPVTMRQTHLGGEKLFVDYAGDTVPVIVDRLTGETRRTQIFVAVMGASNFTYAEATWSQSLPDWIAVHTHAFEALGGVPKFLVPDNTKVAIIKACRYDPQVNRTYADMADHYDVGILPARPRKPRDKAKVEACVLIVERYLLGRLRHRRFHGLAELNQAIQEMLADINERRTLRRLGVTRRKLFEELDLPALKSLPTEPYVYAEWRKRRAGLDYHVDVDNHYYSVPYRFANEELDVRLTVRTVEVFRKGERIAAHLRNSGNHRHTTINEHMPSSHRRFADWTIERIHRDAAEVGASTEMLCKLILESRRHPEQGFRACVGIVRLVKSYGRERVEAACLRALEIGARTYGSVKSILANNLDRQTAAKRAPDSPAIVHPNIRGARYYH